MNEYEGAAPVLASQPFGLGVTVGVVVGFALGTFLALWVGEDVLDGAQRLFQHLTGGDDQINFELLLQ
ncbi:MAG: hypothetical protein HY690_19205 [Chloroflexi bacterium]|nr:hypothetical protein [Chloroflexota bacterium]